MQSINDFGGNAEIALTVCIHKKIVQRVFAENETKKKKENPFPNTKIDRKEPLVERYTNIPFFVYI